MPSLYPARAGQASISVLERVPSAVRRQPSLTMNVWFEDLFKESRLQPRRLVSQPRSAYPTSTMGIRGDALARGIRPRDQQRSPTGTRPIRASDGRTRYPLLWRNAADDTCCSMRGTKRARRRRTMIAAKSVRGIEGVFVPSAQLASSEECSRPITLQDSATGILRSGMSQCSRHAAAGQHQTYAFRHRRLQSNFDSAAPTPSQSGDSNRQQCTCTS